MRLGQNFLADPNLLDVIVREAGVSAGDVVLEVGGGAGALTERLAPAAGTVWVVELDTRLRAALEGVAARHASVRVVWGDAMRVALSELEPPPSAMVSNLPYAIATPLLVRTVSELPALRSWTVMVQREIAERLRAAPGSRAYAAPSVLVQLACELRLLRTVDRAVFTPRPRIDSALLRLDRVGSGASPRVARLVRAAFAHRRKTLPASVELAGVATRDRAREALTGLGLSPEARAEELRPGDFVRLAEVLG